MALLQLGDFAFETQSIPFEQLNRNIAARFEKSPRYQAAPAKQFCGIDDETISLSGKIFPGLHGRKAALNTLREMVKTGNAYILISGSGEIFGNFTIDKLSDNQSLFFADGEARQYDFTIELSWA